MALSLFNCETLTASVSLPPGATLVMRRSSVIVPTDICLRVLRSVFPVISLIEPVGE